MPLIFALLLFFCEIWLLGLILLAAHRSSSYLGSLPLLVVMGGMAAVLQFPALSMVFISLADQTVGLQPGSYLFLPVLLLGLLVVYIVDGTTQARAVLFGIIIITLLAALFQVLPPATLQTPWLTVEPVSQAVAANPRVLLASALALAADLLVLVIAYQAISNRQPRQPSLLAAACALLLALWCDAIVFVLVSRGGESGWWVRMLVNLAGKSLAGIGLLPLLLFYLRRFAGAFPETAATSQRPVLDIFSTARQLEAQARYSHNLLHTLLQINHLIVRATSLQTLLEQTCQLLVANRDYRLVWIGLLDGRCQAVQAGHADGYLEDFILTPEGAIRPGTPASQALETRRTVAIGDIARQAAEAPWAAAAKARGYGAALSLPLCQAEQVLGVLNVYAGRANAFETQEIELLQELADDLAKAITNLEVGSQQKTLFAAAETMLDGLLVVDLNGVIIYANAAVNNLAEVPAEGLVGKNLRYFFPAETADKVVRAYGRALMKRRSLLAEFELPAAGGRKVFLAGRAALVYDAQQRPYQAVISVRDVTRRRQFEHQLLTLNRLVTELVQFHNTRDLSEHFLDATGDLLQAWASAIYLFAPGSTVVSEVVAHHLPEEYTQWISRNYQGLPGEKVIQSLEPAFISDTLNDSSYAARAASLAQYGIRAVITLPILFQEHISGVLAVYYDQPHTFHDDEVQLGQTLAHTLAIALQNVRLYQAEHSQRQLAEALAQAAASLNRFLNLDEVLDRILEQTLRVTACTATNILLVKGDHAQLVRQIGYQAWPEAASFREGLEISLAIPTLQYMLASGQPVLVADTVQDERWTKLEGLTRIHSYAGAALKSGDQVIGFLNVDSDQPGAFTPETAQRLQALADYAAIAIHNAQLYEDSRSRTEELSALIDAAATVSTSLDLDQLLNVLAQNMAKLVKVEGCTISDYDPQRGIVTMLAYHVSGPLVHRPEWNQPFSLEQYPVTRQVLEALQPVQMHAQDPNIDPSELELMRRGEANTLLMLPIVAREQAIGLVELECHDAGRVFTEREITLLLTLGAYAANAIQNARLYAQLQAYASQLEARVRQRTAELQTAKERIEGILASVPDAVFVLDYNNRPVHANQAGEQLMAQALGETLDLFAPDFLQGLKAGRLPAEKAVLKVQGHAYQALASPLPMDGAQGGLVVVYRDVTRFHELDQMKTRFVSDVSHELRTPLTNIMLYLDLLSALDESGKGAAYLGTLQRETKRLGYLIEDLLTISRLEAGRVDISIKPLDVNRLMADLVADRFMMASVQELSLTFVPGANLPLVMADTSLLNQAISNLLTNAINYTPPGGRVTLLTGLEQEDETIWVTIRMEDTGVGISPNELALVFDRFYRGSAGRQTGAGGTGLGLAITKEIVTRLDGKIAVQSELGKGSTFTVWLKAVL